MKKGFKNSLTKQFTLIITAIVTGTVLLCWFLNSTYLERYYEAMKREDLSKCYEEVNSLASEGGLLQNGLNEKLKTLCDNGNISLIVLGSNGEVVSSTDGNPTRLKNRLWDMMFLEFGGERKDKNHKVIYRNDSFIIEEIRDEMTTAEFLVLWGSLDDGTIVMMQTALDAIRESVKLSNTFLAYVGIIAILLGIIIVIVVTRKITEPILTLTDISQKMADLDFTAKYIQKDKGGNELAELGKHINVLSETLEKTISELKAANLELQKDIAHKEQIDELRKEFVANVSHELKTPLALISGYAEGLKECVNDDDESRDFYCEVIMDEADKMTTMVGKLLTLTHIEFGTDRTELERFDITELINGVLEGNSIILKQNEISVEFNEKKTFVWGDDFRIEEVITNYLSNAIHYCKAVADNEKKIKISYEDREDLLRVSVFNTGEPIPEGELEKIWTKFYKVDKARTREYGGSGIGLSIVKAIMDSHGRECGVINHERGVEFYFELDKKILDT